MRTFRLLYGSCTNGKSGWRCGGWVIRPNGAQRTEDSLKTLRTVPPEMESVLLKVFTQVTPEDLVLEWLCPNRVVGNCFRVRQLPTVLTSKQLTTVAKLEEQIREFNAADDIGDFGGGWLAVLQPPPAPSNKYREFDPGIYDVDPANPEEEIARLRLIEIVPKLEKLGYQFRIDPERKVVLCIGPKKSGVYSLSSKDVQRVRDLLRYVDGTHPDSRRKSKRPKSN